MHSSRSPIDVWSELDEAAVLEAVHASEIGKKFLQGKQVARTIVKPTKDRCVVNVILAGEGGKKKKKKKKK